MLQCQPQWVHCRRPIHTCSPIKVLHNTHSTHSNPTRTLLRIHHSAIRMANHHNQANRTHSIHRSPAHTIQLSELTHMIHLRRGSG